MKSRQLVALFVCFLVPWTAGNGLLPLLPVYAAKLGASPTFTGNYLSFAYLSLAVGTFVAGWLSDRLQRRKTLIIVIGVALVPAIWLLGLMTNVWNLASLTAIVWFLAGIALTLASILAGLSAEKAHRGKVFGVLSLSGGLGALIGGLLTGPVADRWGFPTMFAVIAALSALLPMAALFLEDKVVGRSVGGEVSTRERTPGLGVAVYLFLAASTAAGIGVFVGRLGTSLVLNDLAYSSTAISSTGAIGGLVTLPLAPLMGWLSDRIGRRRLLAACYLSGSVGLLVLAASTSLWHFWVVASLVSVLAYVSTGIGSAWVSDLVSPQNLGRAMSLFTATIWIGGIIGFASTGYAVQSIGTIQTFTLAAVLPSLAILLLLFIRQPE